MAADSKGQMATVGDTFTEFLEKTPPNVSKSFEGLAIKVVGVHDHRIKLPRIRLHCPNDGDLRFFEPISTNPLVCRQWMTDFVVYRCRDCGQSSVTYALLLTNDVEHKVTKAMKLGQYPPFTAPISGRIEKLLGKDDLELYRKGARAEAQGLGVGAAAYFRRVVDNQWKRLVKEIRDAATQLGITDLSAYDKALSETQFSKAVDDLKDAIPAKLRILDGRNPLTLLYKPLSVELHTLSDEECLRQAADIRVVLTALLENIAEVLSDQDELKQAANRLQQSGA